MWILVSLCLSGKLPLIRVNLLNPLNQRSITLTHITTNPQNIPATTRNK